MTEDRTATEASLFRKVSSEMYADARFLALSPVQPSGRSLWMHLITGPHLCPIPGLARAGRAALAEELGWTGEAFDKAFREVFSQGMAKADWEARVIWLPNAIKHNFPQSPNVVKSWRRHWSLIPDCDLKQEALRSLRGRLAERGEAYVAAFDEACGKPFGKASAKPSPNQEQEQEQEIPRSNERESLAPARETTPPTRAAAKDPKGSARKRGHPLPEDWLPKEQHFRKASEDGRDAAWVSNQAEAMRNWARANANRDITLKSDWDAAFKGWMSREHARGPPGSGSAFASRPNVEQTYDRIFASFHERLTDPEPGPPLLTHRGG